MPTKTLPSSPNLDHLKNQVRDLMKGKRAGAPDALARIREFHPKSRSLSDSEIVLSRFALSDSQLAIAREYGFETWTKLKSFVERKARGELDLPFHERIHDPLFRRGVDLLDEGNVKGLKALLVANPGLSQERMAFEGGNYFRNPSILEFAAENPIRRGRLPENIIEVVRAILEAKPAPLPDQVNSTLLLTATGRIPRECGVQSKLIQLLCSFGADASSALMPAAAHGEFEAVKSLVHEGAALTFSAACALGDGPDVTRLADLASSDDLQLGMAFASQFGRTDVVATLLARGASPLGYNPIGAHSHSTPLHQAAVGGHLDVVRLLVEAGADIGAKDLVFSGTPLGWAEYAGKQVVVQYLRELQ